MLLNLFSSDESSEEEDEEVVWTADASVLEKEIDLNSYKRRYPAWSLGWKYEREFEEKCAPGPGVYEAPAEQYLKHTSRRAAEYTFGSRPLNLMGVAPGPSDYGPNLNHVRASHPKWTMRSKVRLDDGWLKKTPAPNLYRIKVDLTRASNPQISLGRRPDAAQRAEASPGPAHYSPQLGQREGPSFGLRVDEQAARTARRGMEPGPGSYSPSPPPRTSAPSYTWAKGADRFERQGPAAKPPRHSKGRPQGRAGPPRETRTSKLRQGLHDPRWVPQDRLPKPRMTREQLYDETDGGSWWPSPETCSKEEDVKLMEERYRKWDWRPPSGKALRNRDLPRVRETHNRKQIKNPYEEFASLLVPRGAAKGRTTKQCLSEERIAESLQNYNKFISLGSA
mmetsp:Transcript_38693/g.91674  ORF Transcript_38693/g.91674 Transcript_38693/m.91674 type:complete len:394 (+) Transcript_38693:267-1448(+)